MRWSYFCPHCDAGLNPDETIILVGEHADHRILVGLHPQPGDYQAYLPPTLGSGDVDLYRRQDTYFPGTDTSVCVSNCI